MVKDKENSVSVIFQIFLHNRYLARMTQACLTNLREFIPPEELEVVVVHNQSQLFNGEAKKELTENDIYLPQQGVNLRLGKGLNLGIEASSSNYILILANDVMVHHDFYQPLKESLKYLDFVIPWLWRFGYNNYQEAKVKSGKNSIIEYNFCNGGGNCCLFKRETYEKLGKFDENLFVKCDRDYMWRMEELGLKCGMNLKSHATHLGSMTWINEGFINEEIFGRGFNDWGGFDNPYLIKKWGKC